MWGDIASRMRPLACKLAFQIHDLELCILWYGDDTTPAILVAQPEIDEGKLGSVFRPG